MMLLLAWTSLALAICCALIITFDLARGHRQHMAVMNIVWPVTALWSGAIGLWAYFRYGRAGEERLFQHAQAHREPPPNMHQPFPIAVAKGATHCGTGCTVGDILAWPINVVAPLSLFGHRMFGSWLYGLIAAFVFGIALQYFAIQPMKHLPWIAALKEAIKADTLSLLAWQLGMYGWMAIATFVIYHHELRELNPVFWFMMQIGMFVGFATSYPVNRWLLRRGVKQRM